MTITTKLGKYHLVRQIGRGGMGEVYEAEDVILRRRVALKVLPKHVAEHDGSLERFLREARAAAKLQHPNVVTIHDIGQHDGTYFLAMEMAAMSAEQRLSKGFLGWLEATQIIADACRGLVAAHGAELIHRDIKPSNILLRDDGRAQLADFGLVKGSGWNEAALTASGTVVGTPQYMSPEQCRGERVTRLADIYALGASYYHLLTGQVPYPGEKALQVMMAHCSAAPPDPREVQADVPEACAAIVRRAMAKAPVDRYSCAIEMLAELNAILQTQAPADATITNDRFAPVAFRNHRVSPLARSPLPTVAFRKAPGRRTIMPWVVGPLVALLTIALWVAIPKPAWRWTPLFNGQDLTGLFGRPDARGWFVQDGLLIGRGYFNYIYTNRGDYGDFHCRAEMKLNDVGNSGIVFRCVPQHGMPQGYEAQLGRGEFGNLFLGPHGFEPGTQVESRPIGVEPDTWFVVEVIARGNRVTVKINDTVVTEFTETRATRAQGHLGIQSGSAETVVTIRRFEVRE